MPRMVVRMNPDGSFGPGMRNLAITPAMKPMIKIERAQTSAFMPGLSEPCSRCVQGADKASRHAAGNTAPALTNPNRGPGSNGYEHRTYCSARRQVVQGALVYLHDPHRRRLPIFGKGTKRRLGQHIRCVESILRRLEAGLPVKAEQPVHLRLAEAMAEGAHVEVRVLLGDLLEEAEYLGDLTIMLAERE